MDKNNMDNLVDRTISLFFLVKAPRIKKGKDKAEAMKKGISLIKKDKIIAPITRVEENRTTLSFPHFTAGVIFPDLSSPSISGIVVFRYTAPTANM